MKWRPNNKILYPLIPALLFLLFVLYSLVMSFVESVRGPDGWTFEYYRSLFEEKRLYASISYSFFVTFISVSLSLLIGWGIVRSCHSFIEKSVGKWMVWIPMLFPHFVWGYFVLLLLGQSGIVSSALFQLGWLESREDFPILVQDRSGFGIIITYLWKEIPFVLLMLLPVYAQLPKQYGEVIQVLGGSRRHVFSTIEWPWVKPVLVEVLLILTVFIFTAYEVPALLGSSYPQMTAVLAYDWFYGISWDERSYAFALLFLIALVMGLLSLVSFILLNRKRWLISKSQHQR
ncbi:ABC transporter permease [Jeotgalibacillus sp. S-D1]|uniref:ABC transporter permease n=1 Tax=Jeotgalibacillus sp. S-D1 TaxID=2552189 RepID=UPI001F0FDA38|nr:ABC transporter permease subunit [Jeotgalibacillus sp. S-D1]